MKAIKKKYQKRSWENTGFSRHHIASIKDISFSTRMQLLSIAQMAECHYRNVIQSDMEQSQKSIELESILISMKEGLIKTQDKGAQKIREINQRWSV